MEKIFAVTLSPRLKRISWESCETYFPLYVIEQTSVYGTERQRMGAIKKDRMYIKGNKV